MMLASKFVTFVCIFSMYVDLVEATDSLTTNNDSFGSISPVQDMSNELLVLSNMPPPSSKCWKMATSIFQTQDQVEEYAKNGIDSATVTRMCSVMPDYQQKHLALELARCHLDDLGKPLFATHQQLCEQQFITDEGSMYICLKSLSDAGINAYTHYISYIQQLCTRLTQELVIDYQQKSYREALLMYSDISSQAMDAISSVSSTLSQHSASLMNLSAIPQELKHELSQVLTEQLKETLTSELPHQLEEQLNIQIEAHLKYQLEGLLSYYTSQQFVYTEELLSNLHDRDTKHREMYESWTHYQTALWQEQALAMERQKQSVESQRLKIETLSQTAKPLLELERLFRLATNSVSWLSMLVYALICANSIWILTRPTRLSYSRPYLYMLLVTDLIIESTLLLVSDDYMPVKILEKALAASMSRMVMHCMAGCIYFTGFVYSFFRKQAYQKVDMADIAREIANARYNHRSQHEPLDPYFTQSHCKDSLAHILAYSRQNSRLSAHETSSDIYNRRSRLPRRLSAQVPAVSHDTLPIEMYETARNNSSSKVYESPRRRNGRIVSPLFDRHVTQNAKVDFPIRELVVNHGNSHGQYASADASFRHSSNNAPSRSNPAGHDSDHDKPDIQEDITEIPPQDDLMNDEENASFCTAKAAEDGNNQKKRSTTASPEFMEPVPKRQRYKVDTA